MRINGPRICRAVAWCTLFVGCAVSWSALACSLARPAPSDKELFDGANEVFVGKVLSTELASFPRKLCEAEELDAELCQYVRVRVEVIDLLKGRKAKKKYVSDLPAGPGNCSLAVFTGLYYVFYTASEYNMVLHPGGLFFLGYQIGMREREIINRLKGPSRSRPSDEG